MCGAVTWQAEVMAAPTGPLEITAAIQVGVTGQELPVPVDAG